MTCPKCATDAVPALQIRDVAICSNCGASVFIHEGKVRLMRFSDTETFDVAEMAQLRNARATIARPERRNAGR